MRLGPAEATLTVQTARAGVAAKAGHDLVLEVTRWSATVTDSAIELTADARSLVVREAAGGVKPLSDGDREEIVRTIDAKVLRGAPIAFRSTEVDGEHVRGELTIGDTTRSIEFELRDGAASVDLRQSDYGIKPYSALLGTLKVADIVTVAVAST